MSTIKFKDILVSLSEEYDAKEREQLFDKIEQLETDDDAILGIKLFIEKNGRDYVKMRNTFKSFAALLEEKEKKYQQNINLSWLKYAAMLLAILGITIYFTVFYNKPNNNLSAFEYHEIGLPVLMSSNNNTAFNNAMSKYKLGEFKVALTEFTNLPISDTTIYFKGVCLYKNENLSDALNGFISVPQKSAFYYKSMYYRSLCNIKLNNKIEAIKTLQILAETDNEFKLKAIELLEFTGK